MQDHGLVLETPKGRLAVDKARFVEHPSAAGSCDVVLFAVKACDIESAAAPLKLLVDGGACVVSVLNGVDHQDRIASVPGAGSVLGGLAMVSGVIAGPGLIRYTSDMSGLRFGETDGSMSERALAFRDACEGAGFSADLVPDIRVAQWAKFVGLATNTPLATGDEPDRGVPPSVIQTLNTLATAYDVGLHTRWWGAAGAGPLAVTSRMPVGCWTHVATASRALSRLIKHAAKTPKLAL